MGKRKLSWIIGVALISVFGLNGCHLLKKAVTGGKTMSEEENIVRKVANAQPTWQFIEVRVTGKFEQDREKFSFMATARMEKDSQILVVLRSTLGFEVGRVYANRDSVWINSKMLGVKEKGGWKLMAQKIGYPVDFYALQGILVQSLFTCSGDQLNNLIKNLLVKNDKEHIQLVTNTAYPTEDKSITYLNEFTVDRDNLLIKSMKIKDVKGQWIVDVNYTYNRDNMIRKVDLKGMDSEHNMSVDLNVVRKDIKSSLEINFNRF
jgi:hypothetical protein